LLCQLRCSVVGLDLIADPLAGPDV